MIVHFSAHISKWELVCKFGVIFHIFIISCLCSRFHVRNQWFFYSVITFSYIKCFVHSYTVDVVFTLSYYGIRFPHLIQSPWVSCCGDIWGDQSFENSTFQLSFSCIIDITKYATLQATIDYMVMNTTHIYIYIYIYIYIWIHYHATDQLILCSSI